MIEAVIRARSEMLRAFFLVQMPIERLAKILPSLIRIIKVEGGKAVRKARCAAATAHRTHGDKLGRSVSHLIVQRKSVRKRYSHRNCRKLPFFYRGKEIQNNIRRSAMAVRQSHRQDRAGEQAPFPLSDDVPGRYQGASSF